jgi:hypothetical protein
MSKSKAQTKSKYQTKIANQTPPRPKGKDKNAK